MRGLLQVPVGIVDKPAEQRRDLLWLNLSSAAGHVAIVGGPQSGKSTLLRTLVCALALTHTPREVQFYGLDFGGSALGPLRGLPHVGGVWTRLDTDQVRRTVAEVHQLMHRREQHFAAHNIDSMATYRDLKRRGTFADDTFGDVFLVVDGWNTLRAEYEPLEPVVADIAARGLSFGVHLVATATRWMDLRQQVRDMFGTRLELRLGDINDSVHGRRAAGAVPENRPGRGLTTDAQHFLAALPRIDGHPEVADLAHGTDQLVTALAEAWPGDDAPAVRMLPDTLTYDALPKPDAEGQRRERIPIGIAENDLAPVYADFSTEPHLLLFADTESGKSSFLRALARSITTRYTPDQACVIVIDYRRSLLGAVNPDHLIGYASTSQATAAAVQQISIAMNERLPGADVTAEQLRARNWWTGPELFLLIDDYDLVATGPVNPLLPLLEYAAQARDIGLHIVLTRRTGGASRALYETFLARLREYGSPGIVMSGDRDEGPLLGTVKPQRLPAGRGWLVTRRDGARLIQLAWLPPPAE